jgi:hypothetical protein
MHIGNQAGEKMLRLGIHVIIVIACIIPLQTVSGVDQEHIVPTFGQAYAVDVGIYGHEAKFCLATHICRIKPGTVDIVGGKKV